jgi:hypothetical protein
MPKKIASPRMAMPTDMGDFPQQDSVIGTGGQASKPTPQQQKYLALVRELTESASNLVIKVATCKCEKRDQCKLYEQAQKVASKIEALSELGAEGGEIGKSRRRNRSR